MRMPDRIAALSALWAAAKDVFPYFPQRDLDWDASYRAFLPRVMDAPDDVSLWLTLMAFLGQLQDAHTLVVPPRALLQARGYVPFRLRQLGGRFFVEQAADEALLGAEVLALDGQRMPELLAQCAPYLCTHDGHVYPGRLESLLPLLWDGPRHTIETPAGTRAFSLAPERPALHALPPLRPSLPARQLAEDLLLFDGDILYARIPDLQHTQAAEAFQQAMAKTRPRGVILDVRGCIGGMTYCGAMYAQPFFAGSFGGASKWTQTHTAVDMASASQLRGMSEAQLDRLVAQGIATRAELDKDRDILRCAHYHRYQDAWQTPCACPHTDAPVLVLTDRDTFSAAEDFCCFFRASRRGQLMGERTFGSTGSPYLMDLPEGGRAQVVSVDYALADGTPFIGHGLAPDLPCPPDPAHWQARRDALLDQAVLHMREALA